MKGTRVNFVLASAFDKRWPSKRELIRGVVKQARFAAKNLLLYFRNAWRRHVLRFLGHHGRSVSINGASGSFVLLGFVHGCICGRVYNQVRTNFSLSLTNFIRT